MNKIEIDGKIYHRYLIKTKVITEKDDIIDIVTEYTKGKLQQGDIIVLSESPVAISQGRAIKESEIKVGILAKLLWRGVRKVNYGTGLRSPTSMQCAIDEVGHFRIVTAALLGSFGKLIGKKGIFYKVAGKQSALIDAAHTSPVEPYDQTVIKGPIHTDSICKKIKEITGCETAIMDINDIGGSWVIGSSNGINKNLLERIMKDNPQGQGNQLTPICIVREDRIYGNSTPYFSYPEKIPSGKGSLPVADPKRLSANRQGSF